MATIKLKRSTTVGAVPSGLTDGELAINQADGVVYFKTAGGNTLRLADSGSRIEQYAVAKAWRGAKEILRGLEYYSLAMTEGPTGELIASNTAANGQIRFDVNLDGKRHRYLAIRMKRVSGTHNHNVYYSTSGASAHTYSASFKNTIPALTLGTWQTVVLDMHSLVAGGTDWRDSQIVKVRIDFSASTVAETQIAWIAVLRDEIPVSLEDLGGKAMVQDPPSHFLRQEGLIHTSRPFEMAKLGLGVNQSVASGATQTLQMASVEIDTIGGTTDTAGNPSYSIVVPYDADAIRVTCFATFAASTAGAIRAILLYSSPAGTDGPYTLVRQIQVAPQGGGYTTTVFMHELIQVNKAAQGRIRYVMNVYQDSGGALNVLAGGCYMSVEVLSKKPLFAPKPWMRTIQGFTGTNERTGLTETRDWAHIYANQFSSNYQNMVAAFAGFSLLNLGSVVGWGNNHPKYPFAKHHANWANYPHTSGEFSIAGRTWQEFLTDIRLINPQIKIFIYTTPAYDDLRAWNATTGTQTAGTDWSAGGTITNSPGDWANFITTLDAMMDSRERLIDGAYLDLMGTGNISSIDRDNAIAIVKQRGLNVMCNILGADLANAKHICSCPFIGYGDYVYSEGFSYDSTNGSTTSASTAVAEYVSRQSGRGVRFAGVVEELFGTANAEMLTNSYNNAYTHWLDGYNLWGTYRQPGWMIEHQRAYYDYVGSAGTG